MSRNTLGTAFALIGGIFWGISGVCGQYLFQNKGVTARWLVPVRLLIAGAVLLIYYYIRDRKQFSGIWKDHRNAISLVIYGLAGLMLCQYSYFQTIEWSNAGTATVIQYLGPALIVVWVCLSTGRRPNPAEVIGLLCALSGIFLIATHGVPGNLALSTRALIMGLVSAVSVVIYTVQPAELQKQFDTPLILAWGMLIGGAALFILFRPWRLTPVLDGRMLAALAYIITFGTIAGFSLYMTGVKMIGSVKASLFACIEPVSSMLLTVVWMKVQFTIIDLIGSLLIIATIFILAIPGKRH